MFRDLLTQRFRLLQSCGDITKSFAELGRQRELALQRFESRFRTRVHFDDERLRGALAICSQPHGVVARHNPGAGI